MDFSNFGISSSTDYQINILTVDHKLLLYFTAVLDGIFLPIYLSVIHITYDKIKLTLLIFPLPKTIKTEVFSATTRRVRFLKLYRKRKNLLYRVKMIAYLF